MFCLGQVGFGQAPGVHQLELKERAIETMMKMSIDQTMVMTKIVVMTKMTL